MLCFLEHIFFKMSFLDQTTASFWKILFMTLVFEDNANSFAEKRQKSQKKL
jgi:high-affinity K+ transport system ATPase subunit B